jgi:hypothetical protein
VSQQQITVVTLISGTFTIAFPSGTSYTDFVHACAANGGIWNGLIFYPMWQVVSITAN